MKRNTLILAALVAALCACATEPNGPPIDPATVPASGPTQGYFKGIAFKWARAAILGGCSRDGLSVEIATDSEVVCVQEPSAAKGALAQLFVGNGESTAPLVKARFTLYQLPDRIEVTADEWVETQMASGQMRRLPIHNAALRRFLTSIGASPVRPAQP